MPPRVSWVASLFSHEPRLHFRLWYSTLHADHVPPIHSIAAVRQKLRTAAYAGLFGGVVAVFGGVMYTLYAELTESSGTYGIVQRAVEKLEANGAVSNAAASITSFLAGDGSIGTAWTAKGVWTRQSLRPPSTTRDQPLPGGRNALSRHVLLGGGPSRICDGRTRHTAGRGGSKDAGTIARALPCDRHSR